MGTASQVVISYPEELSDWGRDQLTADRYVGYLRKTLGDVAVGDEFEEFVDVGCCGDSLDVSLRIEETDGERVGPETEVEFTTRDAPIEGGWLVQSEAACPR
ncbi:MAG: hypothetical protein V5A38_02125 [Halolamina sp.]|uniref:hypothetical protein n=1 Tax=Halolamina sp. TaxID=1940283 RepID=UPI002FC336F9